MTSLYDRRHDLAGLDVTTSMQPPCPTEPLSVWFTGNNDPWIPSGLTSGQDDARPSSAQVVPDPRAQSFSFAGHHRGSVVPSECDTMPPGAIPSDSAYGSYNTMPSVATGSVCDESYNRNAGAQSHVADLNYPQSIPDMLPKDGMFPPASWGHPPGHPPDRQLHLDSSLVCQTCHKSVKTGSELKKHQRRHTKPYKCDVDDCPRRGEGFSTPNDLDRHKRSVHPTAESTGTRFKCSLDGCATKEKIWPRADNFKAHLKRVHSKEGLSDEDLGQFKYRQPPEPSRDASAATEGILSGLQIHRFSTDTAAYPAACWPIPFNPVLLTRDVASPEDSEKCEASSTRVCPSPHQGLVFLDKSDAETAPRRLRDDHDISSNYQGAVRPLSQTRNSPQPLDNHVPFERQTDENDTGSDTDSSEGEESAAESHSTIRDGIDESSESPCHPQEPSPSICDVDGQSECSVATDGKTDQLDELFESESEEYLPTSVDLANADALRGFLEMLESKGLLEQHGYKKDSPQETEGTALASTNGPISNQRHACTRCNKTFPRKCELKKHEQRHEKPYGCTHPGCNKRFGSKNDWKRHENSQHFPLESWRCDMKRREDPSSICTFVNHQRFFFRQHLQEAHSLGMNELESKVDGCKVGRNSEVRFWCGFCEAVIENKRKGAQAHNERFNHIGDHFSGRNNRERRDITDWKGALSHESGTLPPAALTSQAKSCRTTRPQPQDANFVRSKRKRDINHSDRPPKRPKAKGTDEVDEANNPGVFPCCHCGELLHAGSKQCMNPDCFHVQCVNCE